MPPLDYDALRRESVIEANRFLKRLLEHGELKTSEALLKFLLYATPPKIIYTAQLPGMDASYAASAARLSGSIPTFEEVDSVVAWTKDKDRLLNMARNKAIKAASSLKTAAIDASFLLTAGGVLLPEKPSDDCGIPRLIESIDDEQRYVANLRQAALNVKEVHDRVCAAGQMRESTAKSFESRHSALVKGLSSTQRDVDKADQRVERLQRALDDALVRFSGEAKSFVRDFPERWSTLIDQLVDDQIATANSLAACLAAARKQIVKNESADDDDDARKLSERILNAPEPKRVAPDVDWMGSDSFKSSSHASKPSPAPKKTNNSSVPDWVYRGRDRTHDRGPRRRSAD